MPEKIMTITDLMLLEKCMKIELLCKELYNYFAELHSDNEDAVRLWRKTAMEEQNHADQFTLVLKLKKGISCLVKVDPAKVESALLQMQTIIEKVKTYPPLFVDALYSSIKLEKHLADFHLGCVIAFDDSSYTELFNAMMASDQEHIAALQAAYDKQIGTQDWTFTG